MSEAKEGGQAQGLPPGRGVGGFSRRDFLKTSAAVSAGAVASGLGMNVAFAAGPAEIKVGLVGCGRAGERAARDCLRSAKGVSVVALADAFRDRLDSLGESLGVPAGRRFVGIEARKELLALDDVNLVILATPPAFRPVELAAAVEAGKNVFVEPPAAICPAGAKMVSEASAKAGEKGLAVGLGLPRRHDPAYVETMKRIHDGAIGRIITGQCYWNQGGLYTYPRRLGEGDLEWQLRNWRYFTWLSGDFIVERHVHNLDVINWAVKALPERVHGLGGRQCRTGAEHGNVYDHFGTEIFYPNDVHVISMCRQIEGTEERIGERVVGSKGSSDCRGRIEGENAWTYEGPKANPFVLEHADLIKSVRAGEPVNDGQVAADSALTAVLARESGYTRMNFKRSWFTAKCTLNRLPPEGLKLTSSGLAEPVPVPGKYRLPGAR